jgi:predicted ATP-grasp superfamily ATP-dependent carboligase
MQSDDLRRFYFLTHEKYSSDKPLGKMIVEIRNGLFDQILLTSSNAMKLTLDPGIPVINFTEDNDLIEKMIDKGIIDKKNLYNNPENSTLVSDKVIFHKTFGDQSFVPKTVFSIDKAEDLKFPIIAKPAKGRSAEGIQKFDSVNDLKKSKEKFDLFSEMIDLDKEYRCFCFKDDVLSLDRRDKVEGSEDFLANTKTETDFIYNSIDL